MLAGGNKLREFDSSGRKIVAILAGKRRDCWDLPVYTERHRFRFICPDWIGLHDVFKQG